MFEGRPFVATSVNTVYGRGPGSDGKSVWYTNTSETKAVRFNAPYTKEQFSPVIQRGAIVQNEFTKQITLPPREEAPASAGAPMALTAAPPPDLISYVSYTAYGVGASLFVACIVLRLRGK